jgi:hypothetical protein
MRHLDTEDLEIYKAWLRRMAVVYGGLVLFGAATIFTLAVVKGPTAATYMAAAIGMAAP